MPLFGPLVMSYASSMTEPTRYLLSLNALMPLYVKPGLLSSHVRPSSVERTTMGCESGPPVTPAGSPTWPPTSTVTPFGETAMAVPAPELQGAPYCVCTSTGGRALAPPSVDDSTWHRPPLSLPMASMMAD